MSRALVYLWIATIICMAHSSMALILLVSDLLLFPELLLFADLLVISAFLLLFTNFLMFSNLLLITNFLLIAKLLMVSDFLLVPDLPVFTDSFLFAKPLLFSKAFLVVWCTLLRVLESELWLPTCIRPIIGIVLLASGLTISREPRGWVARGPVHLPVRTSTAVAARRLRVRGPEWFVFSSCFDGAALAALLHSPVI